MHVRRALKFKTLSSSGFCNLLILHVGFLNVPHHLASISRLFLILAQMSTLKTGLIVLAQCCILKKVLWGAQTFPHPAPMCNPRETKTKAGNAHTCLLSYFVLSSKKKLACRQIYDINPSYETLERNLFI